MRMCYIVFIAPPKLLVEPLSFNARHGDTAVFQCHAEAEPIQSIRWEREGEVIAQYLSPDDSDASVQNFSMLNSTERNVSFSISSQISITGLGHLYGQLKINNVSLVDAGTYVCTVSNVHGSVESNPVELTVQSKLKLDFV